MARVNPTDPLESIDIRERTLDRTKIGKVRQTVFNLGEDYEDPRVQFKYFRNMAARYGSGFVIARRQSGNLWSWGCSAEEPTYTLLDHDSEDGTATFGQLYIGQSFIPTDNWIIDQIYVNYAWVQSGATHCKLTIRADSGGDPGTILATADLLAISHTSAPGGAYTFTFSSPIELTSGTTYWAIFQAADSGGNPSGYFFWYYYGADTYADGYLTYSTDGATWNPSSPYDLRRMKILGRIHTAGYQQLGLGTNSPTSIPTIIDAGGVDFSRVFAPGRLHTLALDTSGAPYTWGRNEYGQIGIPLLYYSGGVLGVGDSMSAAIDSTGTLWTWGINIYGELGDGTWNTIRSTPTVVVDAGPWARLTNYPEFAEDICRNIPGICKGTGDIGDGIWAIKEDGSLWRSGRCNYGQLGIGVYNTSRSSPVSVLGSGPRSFWQCSGGQTTMGCIDQAGDVWTWGRGSDGKLGTWGPTTGSPLSINSPVNVNSVMNSNPISIHTGFQTATIKNLSVGANHCTAIDITGQAWGWGNNLNGQIGNNENPNTQGYPVSTSHTIAFKQTAAGNSNSMWLDVDGNVWMSGYNDFGRYGMTGINQETSTPTIVIGSPHQAIKIASSNGGDSFGFLRDDGTLWLWGENDYGQAGIGFDCPEPTSPPCDSGGTNVVTSPASVIGSGQSYKFIDFWLGGDHTIALDENGDLWAWGKNPECGVGFASGENQTPLQITGLSTFTYGIDTVNSPTRLLAPDNFDILGRAAAAGWGHSLVVDQDDTKLWAWGLNSHGQVGDGTTDNKTSPVQLVLGGGRRFRKIDAGDFHSVTLDQNGKLWSWGKNESGQLGNARGDDLYTPASIAETAYPILSFDFRDSLVSNNNDWVGHQSGSGSGAYSAGWYSGFFDYVEGYTPTLWREPTVLSVEHKSFTIGSGSHHQTSLLTKGQNIDYCVPFMGGIYNPSSSNLNRAFCRLALEGTQVVRCSTGPADSGSIGVEAYIVEFNPSRVRVQRGQFDFGGTNQIITLDHAVNRNKAFIHIQWRSEGTNNNWRDAMIRARIIDSETIHIDRDDGPGDMDVRWWVVESLDDAFDVETVEWQHLHSSYVDHHGSPYYSDVIGNNTNFNRALTLVTCKNNQSGNAAHIQPVAWFDDSSGRYYSKAGGDDVTGRVVDFVGQIITFNDASKNFNASQNGFSAGVSFGDFGAGSASNLSDTDGMYFPGRTVGSEIMYPNTEYSMIYNPNPQGLGATGKSGFTYYLPSCQYRYTYTNGTMTATRGSTGESRTFWSAFEFDNFDETSENVGRVAKSKTRTFGALDGSSAMDGSYVPVADLSAGNNIGVYIESTTKPVGDDTFTFKVIIKTPPVGLGASQSQLIFQAGGSYDIYGVPAYNTTCRIFYKDNRAGSQKGGIDIQHGNGSTTIYLDNFFDPETWYTIHYTYDGNVTTKLFVDNELQITTTLNGVLSLTAGNINLLTTGFVPNKIFCGAIDYFAVYGRDLSEDEILGEGTEQKFIEIAAGSQSSYGIDSNGVLWAWGDNTHGQLGDGTTTNKSAPISVSGRHSFIHVTGGGAIEQGHACGLKPDGSVWCWGRNHRGQLGLCDYTDRSTPASVIGNHSFIDVWAAKDGYNTIAIKSDGSVWVWGKSPFCDGVDTCSPTSIPDFNLITLNILGRGYLEDHSLYLEY